MKNKSYKRVYDNRFDDTMTRRRKKIANRQVRQFNKKLAKITYMIEFNLQFDVNEQLEDDAREFTAKL